jgi:hypothetical protein
VRGLLAVARFRSPLIKPDVRISRIRLSDWISPSGSRTKISSGLDAVENAQPAVDCIPREAGITAGRPHLMTTPEVMPYAFVDVIVDRLICLYRRAVAEICASTSQNLIQSIPHLRPSLDVIRHQKISHFLLDTCIRRRRGLCTSIAASSFWVTRSSKGDHALQCVAASWVEVVRRERSIPTRARSQLIDSKIKSVSELNGGFLYLLNRMCCKQDL